MTENIEITKEALLAAADERSLEYDNSIGRRTHIPDGYYIQLALNTAAAKAREGALREAAEMVSSLDQLPARRGCNWAHIPTLKFVEREILALLQPPSES